MNFSPQVSILTSELLTIEQHYHMGQSSTLTQEKLGHYVYCLVDPADGKVFHVGKGKGNRVFQMTTLRAGHAQRLRGILTVEDIEADYAAKDIDVCPDDYLLLVNISATRAAETLYDAAKGDCVVGQYHLTNSNKLNI